MNTLKISNKKKKIKLYYHLKFLFKKNKILNFFKEDFLEKKSYYYYQDKIIPFVNLYKNKELN